MDDGFGLSFSALWKLGRALCNGALGPAMLAGMGGGRLVTMGIVFPFVCWMDCWLSLMLRP